MLPHKFVRKCTYRHHTNFIFATKQFIFVSSITRRVAKTILHAHYFVNLQTFLSSTINFLSTSMARHYFCHVCATCLPLRFSKIIIFHSSSHLLFFSTQNYNYIYILHQPKWTKNNISLQNNY